MSGLVCCVDVGSTFTKAALVDTADGRLVGTAEVPTTIGTDVLEAVDRCRAEMGAGPGVPVLACSSAGGGLRLAVVGYERLVTAEAGHRVGLSAGARVVHVAAGPLTGAAVNALRAARPDVVLLVGGTDGGNAEVLLHNAGRLAATRLRVPVVLAGNTAVRDDALARLERGGVPVVATDNVLPRIGVLEPGPARAAIRDVFIRHVIGGKKLSRGLRFAAMVRAATPDAVLTGVELLADGAGGIAGGGDVLVVDVGGATTDVYSVLLPDEEAPVRAGVIGVPWRSRTVEGDLGMRWSAGGVVDAALAEGLLAPAEESALRAAAELRAAEPGFVPVDDAGRDVDARLGELAVTVALRRHARPGSRLRRVRLVVGSGGVLRHATGDRAARIVAPATGDHGGGWRVPDAARVVVDEHYVLAAAGLLAAEYPAAGARLLVGSLLNADPPTA